MNPAWTAALPVAAGLLAASQRAVAFTGAGISTPSGIPDFRSAGSGLWNRFDPMQTASLSTFRSNPARFYDWLRPLLNQIWAAEPNPAHTALAGLEQRRCLSAVITQNIDGLHQSAGSQDVLEVHGSLETMICTRCRTTFPAIQFQSALIQPNGLPRCPQCARVLKPDIVLFEERLPAEVWAAAEYYCETADLVLVVGSSLEVSPANLLPQLAVQHGAKLVILNATSTALDAAADVILTGDAAEILPALVQLL